MNQSPKSFIKDSPEPKISSSTRSSKGGCGGGEDQGRY